MRLGESSQLGMEGSGASEKENLLSPGDFNSPTAQISSLGIPPLMLHLSLGHSSIPSIIYVRNFVDGAGISLCSLHSETF